MKLYWYSKCSTCRNAKRLLDTLKITYDLVDIVENVPSADELEKLIRLSEENVDKFFNTRGILYKELGLNKEKLSKMSDSEKIKLLSTDGKLLKRPIFFGETYVLVGFDEKNWLEKIKY